MTKIQILDCTIRDGGHLNNWTFNPAMVKAAYYASLRTGIDYFEIGYRYPPETTGKGDFATCTDELLFGLLGAPSDVCKLAVMIDAGKCRTDYFPACRADKTLVQAVRVAAYPYELAKAMGQLEELHQKGYEVFLNLMASSELTPVELELLAAWPSKKIVSALCFADSFGSFMPEDVQGLIAKLAPLGFQRLGFHPHNNLQMAFANTLVAISSGVEIIDGSVFGMGRGAGNLPIEAFVGYLQKTGVAGYNTLPYIDVISRYFVTLREEIGWGYTLPGLLSGLTNVHPYYLDNLFDSGVYSTTEIWNALGAIKARCPISYSADRLSETMGRRFFAPITPVEAASVIQDIALEIHVQPAVDAVPPEALAFENRHKGSAFLIIANGPSALERREQIRIFSETHRCVTIGVNNLGGLYDPDYHLFTSRRRFEQYVNSVSARSKLLVPGFFGGAFVRAHTNRDFEFIDCAEAPDGSTEPVSGTTQFATHLNVGISAILTAYQMGAKSIYAVGMDGYGNNDQITFFYNEEHAIEDKVTASVRYGLLAKELDRVAQFLEGRFVPFFIITPTSHLKYFRELRAVSGDALALAQQSTSPSP